MNFNSSERHSRTILLTGHEKFKKFQNSHVLIVGLGGVGGAAAEQLARAGVGKLTLVDADVVNESNINRQIIADYSTLGMLKTDAFRRRIADISPDTKVETLSTFFTGTAASELPDDLSFDYAIDAIDTLMPKVNFIMFCMNNKIPLVSSLGAGGKLDPLKVQIADISKTYNDALGRMLRKRLHKRGIHEGFKAVFSPEDVSPDAIVKEFGRNKKTNVGTISYMPALFGIYCASVVIRDLLGD